MADLSAYQPLAVSRSEQAKRYPKGSNISLWQFVPTLMRNWAHLLTSVNVPGPREPGIVAPTDSCTVFGTFRGYRIFAWRGIATWMIDTQIFLLPRTLFVILDSGKASVTLLE